MNLEPDLIDPADEDWQSIDDAALWHAAQAHVPEAVAELARREREHVPVPLMADDPVD